VSDFAARYGRLPDASASAPGRVNLIGEHTDYNGGYVLPIAVPLRTEAALAVRRDREVRAFSTSLAPGLAGARYQRGTETPTHGWIDYVQGVTRALDERGIDVPGFDLLVASQVPLGSGLASSAALEVALLRALRSACRLPLDDTDLARLAHRGETSFVGAPVGVMDQMAASLADERQALFIDTHTLEIRRVPWPTQAALVIIDSGITHGHASGEYRVRRAECARAAAMLGVDRLSVPAAADLRRAAALPEPLNRRVRHVITENARVLAAVAAMEAGELDELGRIWIASHASMRDDYETSLPAIDTLVEIACAEPHVYGARLTGGGFGGAVIVLCEPRHASGIAQSILAGYQNHARIEGRVLLPS
jgi:galactokinase